MLHGLHKQRNVMSSLLYEALRPCIRRKQRHISSTSGKQVATVSSPMEAARRWWNSAPSGTAPSASTTGSPADSDADIDESKSIADVKQVEASVDKLDPAKPSHHRGRYFVNPWPSAVVRNASWIPSFQIPFAWAGTLHPDVKRERCVYHQHMAS